MPQTKTIAAAALFVLVATAQADAGTYTFTPAADAQVLSDYPTTPYGTGLRLTADGSPAAQTLLRFQVANLVGTVTSARLRLYVNNPSPDGPSIFRTTGAWSESTVTWGTKPALSGAAIADLGAVYSGTWVEYNVAATVNANGTYDFALSGSAADGSIYHSRESAEKPQLVILTSTTTTPPPPTT
ncbi:MAG: DNRLRE domain-containing protein, partial [Deltaproteobacteria bacterium]|nr:DNRLRE domain-containing protein [Deltaproteobacteria bacterium]